MPKVFSLHPRPYCLAGHRLLVVFAVWVCFCLLVLRIYSGVFVTALFRLQSRPNFSIHFFTEGPNPSIERTFQRPLRALWLAAHVER